MLLSRVARPTVRVLHAKGRQSPQQCGLSFSRMLDMGGAPSAASDQSPIRTVNASKNNKLQAVAFDFDVLTRSLGTVKQESLEGVTKKSAEPSPTAAAVQPDIDKIQLVASLLNVNLDTKNEKEPPSPRKLPKTRFGEDVRSKYASKLKGGLHGVELAKSQVEDTLKGGDAAGHLAARDMLVKQTAASSPDKWMALEGTGKLLSYLTFRSIRIALLPNPLLKDPEKQQTEYKYMKDFSTQLKEIVVDAVVPFDKTDAIESMLRQNVLDVLDIHPNKVLLVSDKDQYLKAAKDLGMITCRLRPPNAKRGNVSAHYNTPDVASVQEIVNEITGISFNAVLNR